MSASIQREIGTVATFRRVILCMLVGFALQACGASGVTVAVTQGASSFAADDWMVFKSTISPDGKHLAAWGYPPSGSDTIAVRDVSTGSWKALATTGDEMSDVAWSSDSQGLYITQGAKGHETLMFWRVTGESSAIAPSVVFRHDYDEGLSLSPDGTKLALSVMAEGATTGRLPSALVVVDIARGEPRTVIPSTPRRPAVSCWMDNHTVLFTAVGQNQLGVTLRTINIDSLAEQDLTVPGYTIYDATCHGREVVFDGLDPSRNQGIFLVNASTTVPPRSLRLGSYSYVSAQQGKYCAVWSGTDASNSGQVIVDSWSP